MRCKDADVTQLVYAEDWQGKDMTVETYEFPQNIQKFFRSIVAGLSFL
jgi:hypothetical protein